MSEENILVGEKNSNCYVCGSDNAFGLNVPFAPEGEAGSCATYTARAEHGGWSGILHGGVTFSLMDEALGWTMQFQQKPSVTGKITTRFVKPIAIGTRVTIRAWVTRERSRMAEAHAEVRSAENSEELFAEADAIMFRI